MAAAGLKNITASLGELFAVPDYEGELYYGTTIILTNTGSEVIEDMRWLDRCECSYTRYPYTNIYTKD